MGRRYVRGFNAVAKEELWNRWAVRCCWCARRRFCLLDENNKEGGDYPMIFIRACKKVWTDRLINRASCAKTRRLVLPQTPHVSRTA